MRIRKRTIVLLLIVITITALVVVAPWKSWLEKKIIAVITQKGISPVALHIDGIGLHHITLKDVALGDPALKLTNLRLAYSPRELLKGSAEGVELSGLNLIATQNESGWSIAGMDALLQKKSPANTPQKATTIPVTSADFSQLPVQRVDINQSNIHVESSGWQVDADVTFMLNTAAQPKLTLESNAITAAKGDMQLTVTKFLLQLELDATKQQWYGTWSIDDIAFASEGMVIPKLGASGTVMLGADTVQVSGRMEDVSKTYYTEAGLDYSLSQPEKAAITLTRATIPWGGGNISAGKVTVPLVRKKPITVTLGVHKIPMDTLLQALTSNATTATGVVSGTVPIIIAADGKISIGKGALKAEAPGVISLAPDTIPGDSAQVTLVRDVLKNLHYSVLSLNLDMGPDNVLSALLKVEGSNPDIEKNRPIKLQVHLSGDVLNLITQNLKLITDPKTFITQETDEKN